mmetsp:Transcript_21242/g.52237  ORF Transcript_21242/g.52237 Transcript_21242/m.52237 type:complete len:327 (+) Transcript_21242:204-1184(+)
MVHLASPGCQPRLPLPVPPQAAPPQAQLAKTVPRGMGVPDAVSALSRRSLAIRQDLREGSLGGTRIHQHEGSRGSTQRTSTYCAPAGDPSHAQLRLRRCLLVGLGDPEAVLVHSGPAVVLDQLAEDASDVAAVIDPAVVPADQGQLEAVEHGGHAAGAALASELAENLLDVAPLVEDGVDLHGGVVILELRGEHPVQVPVPASHEQGILRRQPVLVAPNLVRSHGVLDGQPLVHLVLGDAGELGAERGELGVEHGLHEGSKFIHRLQRRSIDQHCGKLDNLIGPLAVPVLARCLEIQHCKVRRRYPRRPVGVGPLLLGRHGHTAVQ